MTLHNIVNVFHATCTPKMANIMYMFGLNDKITQKTNKNTKTSELGHFHTVSTH